MNQRARQEFAAPWGAALKVVSVAVTVLLSGIATAGLFIERQPPFARVAMIALPVAILSGCMLFIVRGYALEGGSLVIRRLFWDTAVPLAGLKDVLLGSEHISGSLRLFGNGGVFSFTGIFRNKKLGIYRAYVNDLNRIVVLKLPGRVIVISPAFPGDFVQAVRQSLPWPATNS
jgi:hypothetical protein